MAALVDGCMKTFDRIDSARTYGRDYGKASLKLSLLQLRLSRWAEGVLQPFKVSLERSRRLSKILNVSPSVILTQNMKQALLTTKKKWQQ